MKNRRWDSDRMGQKALVALLSFSLAAGSSPVQVLAVASEAETLDVPVVEAAEPVDDTVDIEEQSDAPEPDVVAETALVDEVPAVEPTDEEPVGEEPVVEAPIVEEPAEAESATEKTTPETATSAQESEAPKDETASEQAPVAKEKAQKSADKKQRVTLSSNHVVVVQTKKDKVEKTALDLDKVSPGDVLWANLLTSDTCRAVTNDKGLSYRWLVADERLEDPKEYTEVVATTRDLTVTEQLQGRYVIVEVTDGTTKCYGPSVMAIDDKDAWKLDPLAFPKAKASMSDEAQQDTIADSQADGAQTSTDDPELTALSVTTAQTPTDSVEDAWGTKGGSIGSGTSTGSATTQVAMSDPLVLKDAVVVFKGSDALVLSPESGKVTKTKKGVLPVAISESSCPVLSDGVIYVPLSDGSVAALHASDVSADSFLSKLWVSKPLGVAGSVSCTVSVGQRDGMTVVIVGTTQANSGSCTILNAKNGKVLSSASDADAGYGQAGTIAVGDVAYAGDDAGVVHAIDLSTGKELSSVKVSKAPLCGSVVAYGKDLLVMDRFGVLHRIRVLKDGTLRERSSVTVGKGSMSSPVVSGKIAVCATCGPQGKESSTGSLVIVNLENMQVTKRVTTADGLPLVKGGITAEPLVSVQGDDLWCYFVVDGLTGTVYRYRVGDAHATELYVPSGAKADRAAHPLACDADGNLYYLNASGFVTKLVAAVTHPQGGSDKPESGDTKPAGEKSEKEDKGAKEDQEGTPSNGAGAAVAQRPESKTAELARHMMDQQAAQQDMMARGLAAMQANRITPDEIGSADEDADDDAFGPGMPEALAGTVGPDGRPLAVGSEGTPLSGPANEAGPYGDASDTPDDAASDLMTVEEGITAALQSTRSATNVGLVAGALALVGLFFYLRKRASLK